MASMSGNEQQRYANYVNGLSDSALETEISRVGELINAFYRAQRDVRSSREQVRVSQAEQDNYSINMVKVSLARNIQADRRRAARNSGV